LGATSHFVALVEENDCILPQIDPRPDDELRLWIAGGPRIASWKVEGHSARVEQRQPTSIPFMPIATVKQLCAPSSVVTSDSLVEQVAQIEDFASGKVDGREFFRRNHFTAGLDLLIKRGFERLAGKSEDGAFYLTQAMGGGKTHSLIAFGLLASSPDLRREVLPRLTTGGEFGAAKVVIFSGFDDDQRTAIGFD
jgi:hypothetical protein